MFSLVLFSDQKVCVQKPKSKSLKVCVAFPERFDEDPDPTFKLMWILHRIRLRIRILITGS